VKKNHCTEAFLVCVCGLLGSFFTGKLSSKSEIKNEKIENETMNIEASLNICSPYLVYSQIWPIFPIDDCHVRYIKKFLKKNTLCSL
jgi:hypothetical protein